MIFILDVAQDYVTPDLRKLHGLSQIRGRASPSVGRAGAVLAERI